MIVKSIFLNGFIVKEVYVKQPHRFEDHTLQDHAFKLKKGFVWFEIGLMCLVWQIELFSFREWFYERQSRYKYFYKVPNQWKHL